MTEILKALDAIISRVLAYRPKDKGVAATKMRDQIKRRKGRRNVRKGSELYNSLKIRRSTDESPTRNFLDDVAEALPSFDDIPSGRSSHSHSPSSHSHGHSSHDYGSSSHGHGHSSHDYGSSSGHSSHDYGSSYDSGSSSSSDGGSYGGSD